MVMNDNSTDKRLVVKHTFLEFVDLDESNKQQRRPRGHTDCGIEETSKLVTGTPISETETNATSAGLPESPRLSDLPEQEERDDRPDRPKQSPKPPKQSPKQPPKQSPKAPQMSAASPSLSALLMAGASPSWSPWRRPDELPNEFGGEPFYFEPLPSAFWTGYSTWEDMASMAYGGNPYDPSTYAWDMRSPDELWCEGMGIDFTSMSQEQLNLTYDQSQILPTPDLVDTQAASQLASSHGGGLRTGSRAERKSRGGSAAAASSGITTGRAPTTAVPNKTTGLTTVMLRNLPAGYTRAMLFDLISSAGFLERCSFVYLPIDFVKQVSLGYALVDLPLPEDAQAFFDFFDGYSDWNFAGADECSASWSDPHQGLDQLVERYRSSPVMHHFVPDEWKPVILQEGAPIPFPPPRKTIKAPKIRGGYEATRQNF